MKSRADILLEGFKLGSLGVSKPIPISLAFQRKHIPFNKKILKITNFDSTVMKPSSYPTSKGRTNFAFAHWEEGMRDDWVSYWGGPFEFDENKYKI